MEETYRNDTRGLSEHEKRVEYRKAQARHSRQNEKLRKKSRRKATKLAKNIKGKIRSLSGPWSSEERPAEESPSFGIYLGRD